jgi:precorrin-2 dehydrogenase/sirohydrochlorin ferrochelatase
MRLLPVSLNVEGKRGVVFGGGPVAARKAQSLLECGATVMAIAPEFADDWLPLEDDVEQRLRVYLAGDCKGAALVFACTNNAEINQRIATEAREAGAWCNVADAPEMGDFHSAATVRRGDIAVSIATGGSFPLLSRHLKQKIEAAIGPEYADLVEIVGARRAALSSKLEEQSDRAGFWQAVLNGPALPLLRDGKRAEAEASVDSLFSSLTAER